MTMRPLIAIFYVPVYDFRTDTTTMEKREIKTGKSTILEAYEVAVANGHNPRKNIKFVTE